MSFSQQVKKEIISNDITASCCAVAGCYGIACFAKFFDLRGLVLHTERAYIANWAKDMFEKAGVKGGVLKRQTKADSFEFSVKNVFEVEKVLAMFSHTGEETALHIKRENFECERCFSAFCAAAFLCGGVVINPKKGYLMEFVSPRYPMMRDFEALLLEKGFLPRHCNRKGYNVLYFKASEQIEDLLTTMGASQSALEIMNLKVYKDFRNRANRITNCETANIDKTVAATRKVLDAINLLKEKNAMESLPQQLQTAAKLRGQYPDYSLAELIEKSGENISKSGLSHRYKKIIQLAAQVKEKAE